MLELLLLLLDDDALAINRVIPLCTAIAGTTEITWLVESERPFSSWDAVLSTPTAEDVTTDPAVVATSHPAELLVAIVATAALIIGEPILLGLHSCWS